MGTSHRCCIIRKVIICKKATAGGRFDSFLDSGLSLASGTLELIFA